MNPRTPAETQETIIWRQDLQRVRVVRLENRRAVEALLGDMTLQVDRGEISMEQKEYAVDLLRVRRLNELP